MNNIENMNKRLFRGIVNKEFQSNFFDEQFVIGSLIHSPSEITSRIINADFEVVVDTDTIGRFTNLETKDGVELCEGDLVMLYGKLFVVVDQVWKFTFERNLVHFGENQEIDLGEDTAHDSFRIGNIHQNYDLVSIQKGI